MVNSVSQELASSETKKAERDEIEHHTVSTVSLNCGGDIHREKTDITKMQKDDHRDNEMLKDGLNVNSPESEILTVHQICKVPSTFRIPVKIGSVELTFVVDTGASCSLLSAKMFNAVKQQRESKELDESKTIKLQLADGTSLKMVGQTKVTINFGPIQVEHNFIGANISDEAILGYDFLKTHHCQLDMGPEKLVIGDVKLTGSKESEESNQPVETGIQQLGIRVIQKCPEDRERNTVDSANRSTDGFSDLNGSIENRSGKDHSEAQQIVGMYQSCFAKTDSDLCKTQVAQHSINTGNIGIFSQPFHRSLPVIQHDVEKEIQHLLFEGVIQQCASPRSLPTVWLGKSNESVHTGMDWVVAKNCYPPCRMEYGVDFIGDPFFSAIDFGSGYWQLVMKESGIPKSIVPGPVVCGITSLPNGLCSATKVFQIAMLMTQHGQQRPVLQICQDEVVVVGKVQKWSLWQSIVNQSRVLKWFAQIIQRLKERAWHWLHR